MEWLIGAILLAGVLVGIKVGEARAQFRRALRDLRETRERITGLYALTQSSAFRWIGWGLFALLLVVCFGWLGINARGSS